MSHRLTLDGVKKSFGATAALRGVSLGVGEGEVHALIGENGAGKSTLMKILSGAHEADAGRTVRAAQVLCVKKQLAPRRKANPASPSPDEASPKRKVQKKTGGSSPPLARWERN